jgi:serine/threonine-protein kinase
MMTPSGIIKIVDFGVAKTNDANAVMDEDKVFGSPMYMSPEQIAGLVLDHRSDMYSLGATFYHAFCGSPPFKAENVKELLDHHLNTPVVPLWKINQNVSLPLSKVIEKMMAKDPHDRYKNFKIIVKELGYIRSRIPRGQS